MSSSDSDDDYYGNVAQKLQALKNNYVPENVETVSLKGARKQVSSSSVFAEDFNSSSNSTDNDELTLDAIIAQNTKGSDQGPSKTKKSAEEIEPIYERATRLKQKTANSNGRRGRGQRGGRNLGITDNAPVSESTCVETNTATTANATTRGRGRGRARVAKPRGRGRGRRQNTTLPIHSVDNSYPIYSVGNTDEYPDESESQQLFSTAASTPTEVLIIDDEDPLESDNEELSVKVYWQNSDVVRFNIRKYQKLTPIFKYFSQKVDMSTYNLLFMYNDKIIKPDDTPDDINYSIAKFIDGGIVHQKYSNLVNETNEPVKDGMKLKFQCQNKKKPFETTIRPQDSMALVMLKCAEHLETAIKRLKFYFDGDLISAKSTPQDLGLEDGECIDVKIIN